MPIYEYKCGSCGSEFSVLSSHRDSERTRPCPDPVCLEPEARKVVSRTSFALKGDGWASDGYSGKGK